MTLKVILHILLETAGSSIAWFTFRETRSGPHFVQCQTALVWPLAVLQCGSQAGSAGRTQVGGIKGGNKGIKRNKEDLL